MYEFTRHAPPIDCCCCDHDDGHDIFLGEADDSITDKPSPESDILFKTTSTG